MHLQFKLGMVEKNLTGFFWILFTLMDSNLVPKHLGTFERLGALEIDIWDQPSLLPEIIA